MLHEFSRTELLLGREAMERLGRCRVAIFGIGGVGSFAAEGLVRCGVGRFLLVDGDRICRTNVNRQIHATCSTIGRPKVEVMKERMLDISPRAEIEIFHEFYEPGRAGELLPPDLDYVVDAIDSLASKIDLIVQSQRRGIPIISSMGAGNKLDPTRFEVADIYQTSVCPLARVLRKELRRQGVTALKVVYSREPPLPLQLHPGEPASCTSRSSCPAGAARTCLVRRQVPGSISFVPAAAGLILAGEVARDLIGPLCSLRASATAPASADATCAAPALRAPAPAGLDRLSSSVEPC